MDFETKREPVTADASTAEQPPSPGRTTGVLLPDEIPAHQTVARLPGWYLRRGSLVRAGELLIYLLAVVGAIAVGLGIFDYFGQHRYIGAYLIAYAGFRIADLLVAGTPDHIGAGDTLAQRVSNELPVLVLFAAAAFERTYLWGGESAGWLGALGLLLQLGGLWLALGARVQLHFFSSDRQGHERMVLVTTGFFRYVRHPTYTGVLLVLMAWPIVYEAPITLVVAGVIGGYVARRQIAADEEVLLNRFGEEFEHYRRTTDALIPNIW
ncbi:MAG TPA: isoprenylcysteine carboxylmethyltransferase family protein [Candidatus Binataceae bacterium]|nr:isoprenylcysteine carboxylmethyltransferase family protein [Candidatus Binataceae bacterium]